VNSISSAHRSPGPAIGSHDGLVDVERGRSQADPFVIATARLTGATVITQERPSGNPGRPKIPDVCHGEDIRSRTLLQMILELGWQFVEELSKALVISRRQNPSGRGNVDDR
jgi:hypothetical protein